MSPSTAFIEGGTTQDERQVVHRASQTISRRVSSREKKCPFFFSSSRN